MKDKILLIGGGGYLGTVLTGRLVESGYNVRILDSFIYGKKSIQGFKNDDRIEIIEGDIRNIETVNKTMNGIDSVIHLAAVVGDPASASRPEQTIETNQLASLMLAQVCKLKGIQRFIYASTCSVYGVGKDVLDEDAPLNPVSLYAKTKISSEQGILEMMDDNFAPTIMRMSTLYGWSPRMRFDLVVNTMTMTAFSEKKINVYGGEQWRPLLHVNDAAESYLKVLESDIDKMRGKVYNVGSEEQNHKIKDVANIIVDTIRKIPDKNVELKLEKTNTDARDYQVSFKRIQTELGFIVKHNIEMAAKQIYQKLDSHEIKDPKQKVYYNHYFDSSEELVG